MSDQVRSLLARSRDDVSAARLLCGAGHFAQAVSRCYYAAFYAAEAALVVVGESRSRHAGVISAFGQYVVLTHEFEREDGKILRSLFERRSDADYDIAPVTEAEGAAAVEDATRFVTAVDEWLAQRLP